VSCILAIDATKSCPPVKQPQAGFVTITEAAAIYRCPRGVKMIGRDTVWCSKKGKWKGKPPRCVDNTNKGRQTQYF